MPATVREDNAISRYYNQRYSSRPSAAAVEPTFQRRVSAALKAIDGPGRHVLDYGCGKGAAALRFVEAGHSVVGVDIAEKLLEFARETVPAAEFHQIGTDSALPFADASFDVCYSSEVIEHVFDIRSYLAEISRVVRPGGQLLLTTPYHGLIKNLAVAAFNFEKHFNIYGGHIRFFTSRSLRHALADAGFNVETTAGIGRFRPFSKTLFVAARKRT